VSNPYNQFTPEHRVWELARLHGSGKTDAEVIEASGYVPHDGTLLRADLLSQYKRDCRYQERVSRTPLDRSLAFTALLETDPSFRQTDMQQGSAQVTRLLTDYYASGETDMYTYTKNWLPEHGCCEPEAEMEAG
jgi:hypothetical protein